MRFVFAQVLGHAVMGACLGLFVSLLLIVGDMAPVFQMIAHASTPKLMTLAFVGVFTLFFTVGAALTGLIFEAMEAS